MNQTDFVCRCMIAFATRYKSTPAGKTCDLLAPTDLAIDVQGRICILSTKCVTAGYMCGDTGKISLRSWRERQAPIVLPKIG